MLSGAMEGGKCRFGQREDAARRTNVVETDGQIRGRKSGIIGFWGRDPYSPFTGERFVLMIAAEGI